MNRRELVRYAGAVGTLAVAGCLGDHSRDQLAIEATAPTLNPGETGVIEVTVSNADQAVFARLPGDQIEVTGVDVSPTADTTYQSFPPVWVWEEPQSSIDAELHVSVDADADIGENTYGVSAANGDKELDAAFTISVSTESENGLVRPR